MNYDEFANKLVASINARRAKIGLSEDAVGKLLIFNTSQDFEDWIAASPDNSAGIALGARCALFQHRVVSVLPDELESDQIVTEGGVSVGFIVDKLDDDAWQSKRF
jgi:hypothetical protein